MRRPLPLAVAALLLICACGAYDLLGETTGRGDENEARSDAGSDGGTSPDAGEERTDGGEPTPDGGTDDAGHEDAGEQTPDAGHEDGGEQRPDAGVDGSDAGSPPGRCPEGMTLIDGGTFTMGRTGGDPDEQPVHAVTLSPYCLDRTEVTVEAYDRLKGLPIQATNYPGLTQPQFVTWSSYCNGAPPARNDHPINCVDQVQAEFYCRDIGGRLPTEAEWEFAARGTTGRLYPWGDAPPDAAHANLCGTECKTSGALPIIAAAAYETNDQWPQTAPVGSIDGDVSPFGIRDLGGNVSEWVADVYAFYPSTPQTNPRLDPGQGIGAGWVLRGASWMSSSPVRLTATARWSAGASEAWPTRGFRCAANPLSP